MRVLHGTENVNAFDVILTLSLLFLWKCVKIQKDENCTMAGSWIFTTHSAL